MPKTLLLADDSVVIQKLVGLSFANEDVELVTTDNGDDALTRAREIRPDLVLADVVMPGKNGYEVCQAIKNDPELNTTPVLLLTGTFEAFDEARARQVGSDGHITKPFEAQGLVDRVTDLLSQPRPAPVKPAAAPAAAPPISAPAARVAAPAAAAVAPPSPAPAVATADGDDAYDFFDDDVQELAAPEAPAAAASVSSVDDAFEFGSDLDELEGTSSGEPDTLDTSFELDPDMPDDLTIAVTPERSLAPPPVPVDIPAPDATRVHMGETMIADEFRAPAAAPVASLDARLAEPVAAPVAAAPPPPVSDPGETMLADDLFADPIPAAPTPPPVPRAVTPPVRSAESALPPAMDSGFEFGMEEPAVPAAARPAPTAPPARAAAADAFGSQIGEDITAPNPLPSGALGLSVDDDPLAGMDAEAFELAGSPDPAPADAAESTHSGYDVSASDLGDPLAGSRSGLSATDLAPEPVVSPGSPPLDPPMPRGIATREPLGLASQDTGAAPEISPLMRDQITETLEKVAWEAFADVSDTIVKQVLQRVESVVWEVVPQMAEALIQEEIRRMKGED